MKVLGAIVPGYIFTAALFMGQCLLPTSSSRSDTSPDPGGSIGFDLAPDEVVDGSLVRVRYRCSEPCRLAVEVVASAPGQADFVAFRRLARRVLDAQNVTVRAWLDRLHDGRQQGTYQGAAERISKVLRLPLLSERPVKAPTECPSWGPHLMWQMTRSRIQQCPHESDVVDMLTFPVASTGEHHGVVRRFRPLLSGALERARLRAVTRPSVSLSVWLFLLRRCHARLCGIIHHVDGRNNFDSVLMQLTDTGDVVIQARLANGADEAFRASVALPLQTWIRLDAHIRDSKVLLDATWGEGTLTFTYDFQDSIRYDDTDGYFVIGGGRYMPGVRGYFGPIKYYRFGTNEVKNQLHSQPVSERLERTHRECREVRAFVAAFLREAAEGRLASPGNSGVCSRAAAWPQSGEKRCRQTWMRETQLRHKTLFHFLQVKEEELSAGSADAPALATLLLEQAMASAFAGDEMKITSDAAALLRASSCSGNHVASLLLAAVHLAGLGRSVDQPQGHVYSLIGALGDDRFALMHAGYKHAQGLDGFPKDLDVACGYYANAGAQTSVDISDEDDDEQITPENIYLDDQDDLRSLMSRTTDVLEFLKFQAARGDLESQRQLAAMLYDGQHGVPKDVASALRWFESSAMQMRDPSAMYDYAVLLMKGHGVRRDYSRGLQLMERAAALGSASALNGLGWYHGEVLKDHAAAVRYYQQAALNGSGDGMFNLGVYYLSGTNPERPWKNETAAFQHFLNASRLGHVAAAVEAAWYFSTGSLGAESQDAERAVMMLKRACERNGRLGFLTREALHAYLRGARKEALVKYVLAAEAGLGSAQSNAAHLCEELGVGRGCQRRYHNHSVLNYDAHPSALLKMGDYYYSSAAAAAAAAAARADSPSAVGRAASMYGRAARAGSPQGMFNLAALAQRGHALPPGVYGLFDVSRSDEVAVVVEAILQRCVEAEGDGALTPCSLVLLGVRVCGALRRTAQSGVLLLLALASLLAAAMAAVPPRSRPVNAGAIDGGGRAGDAAVSVWGACVCALCAALLYHLL